MELRQLRYFVSVVEYGSMGRAALELGVVTSALSQQIGRLESELSTRLLRRTSTGVLPTDAGLAFLRQAQLALRHIDYAATAAKGARLSGHVTIGLAPSTARVVGIPFLKDMRTRYPDVHLRIVESLSGHLTSMLGARQIDLAIIFREDHAQKWSSAPIVDEQLFLIGVDALMTGITRSSVGLREIEHVPLIMPSGSHALRMLIDGAFERAGVSPNMVAEVDGLSLLMSAVGSGIAATIQPGAVLADVSMDELRVVRVLGKSVRRPNVLATLPDDELSPPALAARVVLLSVIKTLVSNGKWPGATLRSDAEQRPPST